RVRFRRTFKTDAGSVIVFPAIGEDAMSLLLTRRDVLGSTAAALATAAAPLRSALAQPKPRYTRYNVTSAKGQEMLKSYGVAVKALLALKPDDPHNWFRNAFIHTLDCPHGNWWFFVWHRGYLGWFEQILRQASGNPDFSIP